MPYLSCLFSCAARSSSWIFLVICSVFRITSSVLGKLELGAVSVSSGMDPSPCQTTLLCLPFLPDLRRNKAELDPAVQSFITTDFPVLQQHDATALALPTPSPPAPEGQWCYHSHSQAHCSAFPALRPATKADLFQHRARKRSPKRSASTASHLCGLPFSTTAPVPAATPEPSTPSCPRARGRRPDQPELRPTTEQKQKAIHRAKGPICSTSYSHADQLCTSQQCTQPMWQGDAVFNPELLFKCLGLFLFFYPPQQRAANTKDHMCTTAAQEHPLSPQRLTQSPSVREKLKADFEIQS